MNQTGWEKNVPKHFPTYLRKSLLLIDERIIVIKLLIANRESLITTKPHQTSRSNNYRWTANIRDLVELIYALYYSHCINDGNVTLKQIVAAFEHMFKIKIPKSSHIFNKNCERVEKTPFIQKLLKNLTSKIADRDL